MPRGLLVLLLLPLLAVAAPVPKSLKGQRQRVDGLWTLTEAYIGDRQIEGGIRIWWVSDNRNNDADNPRLPEGEVIICTLESPDNGPHAGVDFTIRRDDGRPAWCQAGTLEVDGDTIRLAESVDLSRPNDTQPAEGRIVYVLKRVTDKPKR